MYEGVAALFTGPLEVRIIIGRSKKGPISNGSLDSNLPSEAPMDHIAGLETLTSLSSRELSSTIRGSILREISRPYEQEYENIGIAVDSSYKACAI
jgi:hypothetical protein